VSKSSLDDSELSSTLTIVATAFSVANYSLDEIPSTCGPR
jgi:hypothetical protein